MIAEKKTKINGGRIDEEIKISVWTEIFEEMIWLQKNLNENLKRLLRQGVKNSHFREYYTIDAIDCIPKGEKLCK